MTDEVKTVTVQMKLYPFRKKAVGESFIIKKKDCDDRTLHNVRCAASRCKSKHGIKYTIHDTPKGICCLRIA